MASIPLRNGTGSDTECLLIPNRLEQLNIQTPDTAPPHRCWAEIDLAAFERNLKRIQASLPAGVSFISVVKADAYGHGMPQMVRRVLQSGVDYLAVANVHEAADIRHMGMGCPILILSPILPHEDQFLIDYDATATISSLEEAQRLNQLAVKSGRAIQLHLKIDTGMGRLGVWHSQASALLQQIAQLPGLILKGIYTHFSSAENDPAFTELQRERFLAALPQCTAGLLIHADNSAGIQSLAIASPFNAVRIGLLQFGISACLNTADAQIPVEPVFSFHTRVGLVKSLPAGTDISYGRSYRLKRSSRIAVLTAGYADGVPVELGNKSQVLIAGQGCPILGRVTMDQTVVDVTDLPQVRAGDCAVLIGQDGDAEITTSQFSHAAVTIPWETLCSITKRVARVYISPREL